MTAAAESVKARLIPAAVERVRLSYLCGRSQVDVAVPLDVPIVVLLPELVKVALAETESDATGDSPGNDGKRDVWVLIRYDDETALATDGTLREAGVTDGELLRLSSRRALSVPSLYDDAVDAAARLNKAGHPGWDRTTAKWMSFVGVHLASAVWVYLLVTDTFAASRGAFVGLSAVAALALAGAAALAQRSHGQSDAAAALGWAVLPIAAGISWVALSGLGAYGLVCGCAAMVLVAAGLFRAIGAGGWGYLTAGVIFGLGGLALLVHAAGVRGDVVGAGLATFATLAWRAVGYPTTRSFRWKRRRPARRDEQVEGSPTSLKLVEANPSGTAEARAAESSRARLQATAVARSALATGLAVSAGLGASVVLPSTGVRWPELAFAAIIAIALALHGFQTDAVAEAAGLTITAVALAVLACVRAMHGTESTRLTAFIALLVATGLFALIGANGRTGGLSWRARTLLAYGDYLATAALIPLALWAIGIFGRVEFR